MVREKLIDIIEFPHKYDRLATLDLFSLIKTALQGQNSNEKSY